MVFMTSILQSCWGSYPVLCFARCSVTLHADACVAGLITSARSVRLDCSRVERDMRRRSDPSTPPAASLEDAPPSEAQRATPCKCTFLAAPNLGPFGPFLRPPITRPPVTRALTLLLLDSTCDDYTALLLYDWSAVFLHVYATKCLYFYTSRLVWFCMCTFILYQDTTVHLYGYIIRRCVDADILNTAMRLYGCAA